MALISQNPDDYPEIPIPHEPGQWVKLRPMILDDVDQPNEDKTSIRIGREQLARQLLAWSYAAPPSQEAIGNLDLETSNWIQEECGRASGIRDAAEKKDSKSSLPPTTAPARAASPPSSVTSVK